MDRLTKEQRRKNMRAVRSKGSEIEHLLSGVLRKKGYRFKTNYSKVFGKPDIVFPASKIAVFCDSEFWHGKDWLSKKREIKSNRRFWINKIESNIARDAEVNKRLKKEGWTVIRLWGKRILGGPEESAEKIERLLQKGGKSGKLSKKR